ncbi:MAG: polyhydroxybutyrate depolymerase, partial [Yoonia sp.]
PSFRRRLQNAKTGFRRYDLENGRVGSISKMSGKRDEVQVTLDIHPGGQLIPRGLIGRQLDDLLGWTPTYP